MTKLEAIRVLKIMRDNYAYTKVGDNPNAADNYEALRMGMNAIVSQAQREVEEMAEEAMEHE